MKNKVIWGKQVWNKDEYYDVDSLALTKEYVDDNGKLSTEEIYRRLDNMDISVIETYLREKKLKKLKEQIKK